MGEHTIPKVILIVINLLFFLASLVMVILGILLAVIPGQLVDFLAEHGVDFTTVSDATGQLFDDIISTFGYFMIGVGVAMLIISLVGLCAACTSNKCCILLYVALVGTVVLAEIALIIFAAVYPDRLKSWTGDFVYKEVLSKEFKNDIKVDSTGSITNGTLNPVEAAWMIMQFSLGCCGSNNHTDYGLFDWNKCGTPCTASIIPISCCALNGDPHIPSNSGEMIDFSGCVSNTPDSEAYNSEGCVVKIINFVTEDYTLYAIITSVVVIVIEMLLIIFALVLCKRSDKIA